MVIKTAAILGGAEYKEEDVEYKNAFEVCKLLAQNGITVCNGGGPGIMRAATVGAHLGGGKVVGVTYYPTYPHAHYEGRDPRNTFDEEIITPDYFNRTKRLLELGNVHILFRGGTGTIGEFGMTWASSRIHEGHNIPIILFGGFWGHIIKTFREYMYLRHGEMHLYNIVEKAEQVVPLIEKYRKELPDILAKSEVESSVKR